ncbi:hypothetical protein MMMB2_0969 [Mycobacterium marinum MB2]|nr:hypothetical protein MMMB2_0969 [Mycobacterium marinum MB2]
MSAIYAPRWARWRDASRPPSGALVAALMPRGQLGMAVDFRG